MKRVVIEGFAQGDALAERAGQQEARTARTWLRAGGRVQHPSTSTKGLSHDGPGARAARHRPPVASGAAPRAAVRPGVALSTGCRTSPGVETEQTRSERPTGACHAPKWAIMNAQLRQHTTAPDVSTQATASALTRKCSNADHRTKLRLGHAVGPTHGRQEGDLGPSC